MDKADGLVSSVGLKTYKRRGRHSDCRPKSNGLSNVGLGKVYSRREKGMRESTEKVGVHGKTKSDSDSVVEEKSGEGYKEKETAKE